MLEILETKLPETKLFHLSLTNFYGISKTTSKQFCKQLGISKNLKTKDLNFEQIKEISDKLINFDKLLNENLKKNIELAKKRLINLKTYRGMRLVNRLPVRGQRTHTNAKTIKRHS